MLSETQTFATLHQHLPNHIVYTIPASTVGRRGQLCHLAYVAAITHATTIGVCYVPPETTLASQSDGRSTQLRFQALTERLLVAIAQGHAILAGDFNARVGSLPDPWVADVGTGIPPQLQSTDSCRTPTCAAVCRQCDESLHWQDLGRHPCTAYFQGSHKHSLDHVLVDPDLFSSIQYYGVGLTRPD
ncbi:TPA: hypothetical protein ACH3X1_012536 [Trebouxia sp. C0004]